VLALPLGPSRLTALTAEVDGAPRTLVFVVSYDSRRLTVIDPEARRVVTRLQTQRGPHQLVRDPRGEYLFVMDFLDSTVEVLRLRPNMAVSAEQRTRCPDAALCRVLTLGLPSPPVVNR
jgi:hypothetical protein